MYILSEITGKEYKSVDECLADEKEFLRKQEEEEKAKKAHDEEVAKAYDEAVAACERYFELLGMEVNIHKDNSANDIFSNLFAIML